MVVQNYYAKRLFQAILTVFAVVTVTFAMVRLMPGGPMDFVMANIAQQEGISQQQAMQIVETYTNIRPDEPLWKQYLSYLWQLAHFDLGKSYYYGKPVSVILADTIPWTVFLASIGVFFRFTTGVVLGAMMAYWEGSDFDYFFTITALAKSSIPYYVVALILLFFAGYRWGWFPIGGRMNPNTTPGFNWPFIAGVLDHAALPIASMVITGWGAGALGMRANAVRVLGENYLRVARLRGLPSTRIGIRYVARNAILPRWTSLMISIGGMFGGSVILETIFSYPGVGFYLFKSISARDYTLMMGAFLVITITVVLGIFVADLTYGKLDPRAQTGSGGHESF